MSGGDLFDLFNIQVGEKKKVCCRCRKSIKVSDRTIYRKETSEYYGRKCYVRIQNRQDKRLHDFARGLIEQSRLIDQTCFTCGHIYKVNKDNESACGVNPRCCFCCPYSQLKFGKQKCLFEKRFKDHWIKEFEEKLKNE